MKSGIPSRVSIYDKAGSARWCGQADHGSLERSSVCVVWGCNESPPRVERGSADWEGSHTIAKRIFPTVSARGIETPRSSPVRASFQRKECLSACRYVMNTRSLVVFNVTSVFLMLKKFLFSSCYVSVKIQWRFK